MSARHSWWKERIPFAVSILVVSNFFVAAYFGVQTITLQEQLLITGEQIETTSHKYQAIISEWRQKYGTINQQNQTLASSLGQEQLKNDQFQAQINGIKGSVDLLQKLSETDKELLQKYSKIYFLNENYMPAPLAIITNDYVSDQSKVLEIHGKVWPYLKQMMDDASATGLDLRVLSAFRSFEYQSTLKSDYRMTFGSDANAFSADQGYSEHQLGSTVDFTTKQLGANFSTFEKTAAYSWLISNAHRYGFVLSYPKNNSYYVFEPWHWRFVGTALATRLYNDNKFFYDLEQREIDKYLVLIFG